MSGLFAALGVDAAQWRALTAVALTLDWRTTSIGRQTGMQGGSSAANAAIMQLVFYALFGAFMAFFASVSRDLFLTGIVITTYTMFIVGTTVLLDHNSALTSPQDYAVLGFRPVSSRTYFAVKLTNVLVYTMAVTTAAVWLPAGALFVRYGAAVGFAGLAMSYLCAAAITLMILVAYSWMLKLAGPAAIKRALSYVQLITSFAVYGGYFILMRVIGKAAIERMTLVKTPLLLLFPGSWFAVYLELASGGRGPMVVWPAVWSVAVLACLATALGGRLSLEYSERLGALTTATERPRAAGSTRAPWWFRTGEARAVALLVRTQFRNDQSFRMAVLGILPMTLIYLFMGVHDRGIGDPFDRSAKHDGFSLVAMAIMMFPSMLKMSLTRSPSFRASWVFFACPADRVKIVRAAKNVLVALFLMPYLLLVDAVMTWCVGHPVHVFVHILLMGLMSHLALQIVVFMDPELPFAKPPTKGRQSGTLMGFMMVMGLASVVLQSVSAVIYASVVASVLVFSSVIGASVLVDRLTRARIDRQTESLEFQG